MPLIQFDDGTWGTQAFAEKQAARKAGIVYGSDKEDRVVVKGTGYLSGPVCLVREEERWRALNRHGSTDRPLRETLVANEFDIDKTRDYRETRNEVEMLSTADLFPLPFAAPTIWTYIGDIVLGTLELALYIIVMLAAIMVEASARDFRGGTDYRHWWLKLYKVCVVCYPAAVMLMQASLVVEGTLRKFCFHRLLSLRVMVHVDAPAVYNTWFFLFFISLWVLLNLWAFWGVVVWWGRNGQHGPERLSLAVLGVVNIVAIHLLVSYRRLLDTQRKFLTPMQAMSLGPMYIVPETALKAECWRCMRAAWCMCLGSGPPRLDIEWLKSQAIWKPPCTVAEWMTWQAQEARAAGVKLSIPTAALGFDSDGKGFDDAASYRTATSDLSSISFPSLPQSRPMSRTGSKRVSADGGPSVTAPAGVTAAVTVAPSQQPPAQRDEAGAVLPVTADSTPATIATAPKDGGKESAPAIYVDPGYTEKPLHKRSKCWECCCWTWSSLCCCVNCIRLLAPAQRAGGFYMMMHAWVCSVSFYDVWPYRPDRKYLRTLIFCHFLSLVGVAAVTVYGIWLAVGITPGLCQTGSNACEDCYQYQMEYVKRDGTCDNEGWNITKPFNDYSCTPLNGTAAAACPGYSSCTFYEAPFFPSASSSASQASVSLPSPTLGRAYLMAVLSAYAYPSTFSNVARDMEAQYELRFGSMFKQLGFADIRYIYLDSTLSEDTQAVVARTNSGDIFIALRGTDSLVDALTVDAAARCEALPELKAAPGMDGICVHRGFVEAFKQMAPALLQALAQLDPASFQNLPEPAWRSGELATAINATSGPRVWITGHSLGGALAVLSAVALSQRDIRIAGVYTFGSPRVGNHVLRDVYNVTGLQQVTYRFVNQDDVIAQLPPEFGTDYKHVGQTWVCRNGATCAPASGDECVNRLVGGLCYASLSDHLIATGYLPTMLAALKASGTVPTCAVARLPYGTTADEHRRV